MRSAVGAIQRLGENHYKVSVEGPKKDGRRSRRTKTVRGTRKDAEIALVKLKLESGKELDREITLSEYWSASYRPYLDNLAPSTRAGYERAWKTLVSPRFGDRSMSSLKARDIEYGINDIKQPGEQRNAFKLMRQMFNEAYRDELISENPFTRRIRLKRMEKYEPEILLLDDFPKWFDVIRDCPYEPVLLVTLFSGLRREEACALYWEDFSFSNGLAQVRVDKALTEVGGKVVEGPTKTAESRRTVFIGGWPAKRLEELCSIGPLVPDKNGNRMAPDKISKEYKRLFDGKDAKYVPMRNLRNSYATMMQGLGVEDSLISKALGHTNLTVDYRHYFAANMPAHMANAAMLGDAVGDFL